ncbi:MAG: hypothetical protein WAW85_11180 [Gordonia sp. (in: high G+C Gram-positive bacteria)]|uniref:hypothetical protein n=1 Tax=Gordonia sp. (in: high G+C Gram-positive bacteria) TaxID=84139 RepID=UPI003BB65997
MPVSAEFLPAQYNTLVIEGYEVDGAALRTRYALTGPGVSVRSFTETFDFGEIGVGRLGAVPNEHLLRLLAITACVSYYKLAAPSRITVAFAATEFELDYLRQLIGGGLGEFAYENDLPGALTPTVDAVEVLTELPGVGSDSFDVAAPALVPVGGGKDSVVTLEALKSDGRRPVAFSVNQYQPIDDCISVSGLDAVRVRRKLDPKMGELNAGGAYNGHIPVTAINSAIGLITADLLGLGPVIMSNEQSADIENLRWHGFDINHQWSKSIGYENLLRSVLGAYGLDPDRYFSLLRALPETAIADKFAQNPQYFDVFVSCNRSFALDPARRTRWCGECPKCLFVFVILAPRIGKDRLVEIFAGDVLDRPEHQELYRELAGMTKHKPFECVGDYSEVAESLVTLMDQPEWADDVLVKYMAGHRPELEARASGKAPIIGSGNVPAEYAGIFAALTADHSASEAERASIDG